MLAIINGEWIADFKDMICLNMKNKIKVCFERKGHSLIGKIWHIPNELMEQFEKFPGKSKLIQDTIKEAEKVFLKAYIDNGIDKN